jgi:hypothetical protein
METSAVVDAGCKAGLAGAVAPLAGLVEELAGALDFFPKLWMVAAGLTSIHWMSFPGPA